jgi:hypothetical protein
MDNFAALDDSLVYQNSIYVYSHALTVFNQEPEVIYFVGDNQDIYLHESELADFVRRTISSECSLFACMHYFRYSTFWEELVSQGVDKQHPAPRSVHKTFIQSHHAAKETAKRVLEERIKS